MTLLHQIFARKAASHPSYPFMDDDRVGVYGIGESFILSKLTANLLYNIGLRPGDALAFKATRSASTAFLFYATQILGLIAVPVDERADLSNIRDIDPRVKAVAYQKNEKEAIRVWTFDFHGEEKSIVIPEKADPSCDFQIHDFDENADCMWVFTSGSEGKQKIVRHSQKTLVAHCRRYTAPSSCDEHDRGAVLLPLNHVF